MSVLHSINEPKFEQVMTCPHKGMDLAKICIGKMVYKENRFSRRSHW